MKLTPFIVSLTCAVALLLSGCTSSTPTPPSLKGEELDNVLAYSEPIADSLMSAYQKGDYTAFVRNFDDKMLEGMPESSFTRLRQQLDKQVGGYQSRSIDRAVDFGDFVTIYYKSEFDKTNRVQIVLSLTKTKPHKITGLWFR